MHHLTVLPLMRPKPIKMRLTRERYPHPYKECFVPLSNRCGTYRRNLENNKQNNNKKLEKKSNLQNQREEQTHQSKYTFETKHEKNQIAASSTASPASSTSSIETT
ncbi:hypothetical protein PIB30_075585 [Stylosanthes scabra]|uniref:Uncharacterized protein n=1 Tax=Stylosanthes scabra TaxID=79078 RepID=A0ABU6XMZ2_9FABA|nr:hypothetical protein [Stylosanthes scabra]